MRALEEDIRTLCFFGGRHTQVVKETLEAGAEIRLILTIKVKTVRRKAKQ